MVTTKDKVSKGRRSWPVPLFFLPFDTPCVVSLGLVSSSFLLRKRRRGQGGCLAAIDVNGESPRGDGPTHRENKEKVRSDTHLTCKRVARNERVAREAVQLLSSDQEMERVHPLPPRIRCGQIRSAVRQVFPASGLSTVQELSIKTAQKLELGACDFCKKGTESILNDWKEQRFKPAEIDEGHLAIFKKALSCNVDSGWNRKRYPYVPNGNATQMCTRAEGGNWTDASFTRSCVPQLVWSAGKPRVVTLYGGGNSEALYSLHHALYDSLRKKGWLLVGSPTDEQVASLNGDGPYVSVDYSSATDNIRLVYVRAAIEVLKEKADKLTMEELRALDVLGRLEIQGDSRVAHSGQPMGSMMSFPLLCLVNKTVVDLSVADMASAGKCTWKEFCVHRCLINGDDLLYREFQKSSHDIFDGILFHGGKVGLVTNKEKTMIDPEIAEVNSTSFRKGVKQKKTNVGVIVVRREVADPIGYLADSVLKRKNFSTLLSKWSKVVKNAERKVQGPLPPSFWSVVQKRQFRDSLCSFPSGRPKPTNPFPVVPMPDGYDLSREDEVDAITEKVKRLREQGYTKPFKKESFPSEWNTQSLQAALRRKKPTADLSILKVCADRWGEEIKKRMKNADLLDPVDPASQFTELAWDERSKVSLMIDTIQQYKRKKVCATPDAGFDPGGDFVPFAC
ncbi:RNA dependent RNA polymerase [Diplodia seriata botourmiavirus 2]|nr:RNA dependent RNA polymerase [Diplodia seriata botourmiavirus 2]